MDLTWCSAAEIRDLVVAGDVSAVEVTEHFLGRAEELDPVLHCYRTLDASGARAQAQRADDALRRGDEPGILHGVPVAVKEHIAVEGLPLKFSLGFMGDPGDERAPSDAPVVRRLREAGAIVMGTNVMPGMGSVGLLDDAGEFTEDLAFHPRNPYDLGRVPGSSSAGGCAAVAGGVLPLAIGSDGGGSTRLPASWSGLLGVHTTQGRVPMGEPAGTTWNTSLGPLTRDVRSGALALQAIAGPDGAELISIQTDAPDYLSTLDAGVEGLRFAWTDDYGFARKYAGDESERVIDAARTAAFQLADLGAEVESTDETFPDWVPMLSLGPQGMMGARQEFARGAECRTTWWEGFRRIFAEHDVLVTTTIQHIAFTVERWDTSWREGLAEFSPQWCAHTFPENFLGWPALSVPCGLVDGMPVSIQLIARPDGEPLLYRVAAAFLEAFPFDARPSAISH